MNELLTTLVGPQRCERLLADVAIPPQLAGDEQPRGQLSRAAVAMAMSLVLFEDLLARVPSGARYVASQRERGRQVVFDTAPSGRSTGTRPGSCHRVPSCSVGC